MELNTETGTTQTINTLPPRKAYWLSGQDHATILAALRFYQEKGQGEPDNRSDDIHEIATAGGSEISMDAEGIDDLCERLNCSAAFNNSDDEEEEGDDGLTWECVATFNGWHFDKTNPDEGFWCRAPLERETPNGLSAGKPVVAVHSAEEACKLDGLTIDENPSPGEFDVLVQQYVEQVATVRVRAKDADEAVQIARAADAGVNAIWFGGDDAMDVDVYAVMDHTGKAVWER